MRHRKKTVVLDRKKAPREAMLRNMMESIILYEKIRTTEAKAKAVKPLIERLITKSKDNTLHTRRELKKVLYTKNAINKCLDVLGPRYSERAGGYTRIVKVGPRLGDGAKMVQIELV